MPTYHQILTWKEDDHGSVTATVVISDDYDDMFGDLTAKSTEISCIIIDKVSKSIKDLSGGAEQRELKMIIDEALSNPQDAQAISFIKSAENVSNIIFVALFIDTAIDDIDPSLMIFNGVIQSNIEADDLVWYDDHFGKDISPKRRLKLSAKPYDISALAKFTLYDLIYGNDAQNVPGIDSTWEDENVADRIGGYKVDIGGGKYKRLIVDKLVNFNDLLRKITDNLETAISNNGLGEININYDVSKIVGLWHPVQFNYFDFVKPEGPPDIFLMEYDVEHQLYSGSPKPPYRVLQNDYLSLYINPDGKPENFDLDAEGKHNNDDTYIWLKSSPWVSYRRIKYYSDEPSAEQWKEFRYSTICKDFPTFITQLASELGMFVKFYWANSNELRIKFYERDSSNLKQIKLKSANKATIQPTSSNIDKLSELSKKSNVATYYAMEGADYSIYTEYYGHNDKSFMMPSERYSREEHSIPILSISPTTVYKPHILPGIESKYKLHQAVNHIIVNDDWAKLKQHLMTSTAIYCYKDAFIDVPNDYYAPSSFWTPVGAIRIRTDSIYDEDKIFYSLTDYQRFVNRYDTKIILYEYGLDIPYIYCASYGDEISWKYFDLLNYLQLDNTWYTIVAYEIDLKNVVVKLTLQSTSRFSFQNPELDAPMPEPYYVVTQNPYVDDNTITLIGKEVEGISHLDFVAMLDDGTIVKAAPQRLLYHKLLGFAIVRNGVLSYVKTSGIITDNDLPDFPKNTLVHLRYSEDSINISDTGLTTSNAAEDMICILGKYIDEKTIKIDDGYPHRILLAPYNPM